MEINNADLLKITGQKAIKAGEDSALKIEMDEIKVISCVDWLYIDEQDEDSVTIDGKTVNLFGSATDSEIESLYSTPNSSDETEVKTLCSETGNPALPNDEQIKSALYRYFNPEIVFTNGKYSFKNTDELFEYFADKFGSNVSNGITKAQLTSLTQDDDAEDQNNDFFGVLNRAFAEKGPNDVITYKEINNLLIKAAGSDARITPEEFKNKVNQYSNKVQNEFASCSSNNDKMEFILKKTREYLIAAGLDVQLAAMDRLLGLTDTNPNGDHVCNKGQIAFAAFEPNSDGSTTLGTYQPTSAYSFCNGVYTSVKNNQKYWVQLWAGDEDGVDTDIPDGGLTLNSDYLDANKHKWYEVVDTMVHELTHATAYYYYNVVKNSEGNVTAILPTANGLDYMKKVGALTNSEYDRFSGYIAGTNTLQDDELARLEYLLVTMWGEYRAYQADANYLDSIGADVLDGSSDLTTAVNGSQEQSTIEQHIYKYYDNNGSPLDDYGNPSDVFNPCPDWDWWSYKNSYYA